MLRRIDLGRGAPRSRLGSRSSVSSRCFASVACAARSCSSVSRYGGRSRAGGDPLREGDARRVGLLRVAAAEVLEVLLHGGHVRAEARVAVVVPVLGPMGLRLCAGEQRRELVPGVPAARDEPLDLLPLHRQVETALAARELDVDDALAEAGHPRLGVVAPVLHRVLDREQEVEHRLRLLPALDGEARGLGRQPHAVGRIVEIRLLVVLEPGEVDREGRPRGQRRVEELHREVGGDAPVGEDHAAQARRPVPAGSGSATAAPPRRAPGS